MYSLSSYVFSPLSYFFNKNSLDIYNKNNIDKNIDIDFEILGDELDSFDILNEIIYTEDIKKCEKTNNLNALDNFKDIKNIKDNFIEQYKKNWDNKINQKILKERAKKKRNRNKYKRNKNKRKID